MSPYDRMMKKVHVCERTGCWLFTGANNGGSGHGQVYVGKIDGKRKKDYAHRIAYRYHHGEIPLGMVVRHSCEEPAANCVNPDHIKELGTVAQNNADIAARQRGANQYGNFTSFVETTDECPF